MISYSSSETSSVSYQNGNQKPRKITITKSNDNGDKKSSVRMNKSMRKDLQEAMGLVGIGGMPSPYQNVYITQYTYPTTFSNTVEGYGISNDILADKILTNRDGELVLEDTEEFLEDRNFRVFKYIGENNVEDIYKDVLYESDDNLSYDYIYEAVTGKKLLCDEQIYVDPVFEEVDPDKILKGLDKDIMNIEESVFGILEDGVPIFESNLIYEAENHFRDKMNYITVYESLDGFYIRNDISGERSAYYDAISDIPLEME